MVAVRFDGVHPFRVRVRPKQTKHIVNHALVINESASPEEVSDMSERGFAPGGPRPRLNDGKQSLQYDAFRVEWKGPKPWSEPTLNVASCFCSACTESKEVIAEVTFWGGVTQTRPHR